MHLAKSKNRALWILQFFQPVVYSTPRLPLIFKLRKSVAFQFVAVCIYRTVLMQYSVIFVLSFYRYTEDEIKELKRYMLVYTCTDVINQRVNYNILCIVWSCSCRVTVDFYGNKFKKINNILELVHFTLKYISLIPKSVCVTCN